MLFSCYNIIESGDSMGQGFGYICKKCKNQKDILYGIGFLGYKEFYKEDKFKNLIDIAKEEKLNNLSDLIDFIKITNVDIKDGYGYDAYICPNCKRIDNKFRYSLFVDDKTFVPKYSCKYCGCDLRVKKEKEDFKLKCDKCGCEDFEKEAFIIDWD